jgi:hypothetical protein
MLDFSMKDNCGKGNCRLSNKPTGFLFMSRRDIFPGNLMRERGLHHQVTTWKIIYVREEFCCRDRPKKSDELLTCFLLRTESQN